MAGKLLVGDLDDQRNVRGTREGMVSFLKKRCCISMSEQARSISSSQRSVVPVIILPVLSSQTVSGTCRYPQGQLAMATSR